MKHRARIREYQTALGIARKLPDGRKLIVRTDQDSVVVDPDGGELAVFSSDLKALLALSEMSFPKRHCFSEWSEQG
jgi:hypothetical protein